MVVKKSDLAMISNSIEPRRDIQIVKTNQVQTIEELPNVEI